MDCIILYLQFLQVQQLLRESADIHITFLQIWNAGSLEVITSKIPP